MAAETDSQSAQLLTELKTFVKQHVRLDAAGRTAEVYTARATVKQGEPCSITKYGYLDGTSTMIINRKEIMGTWDPDNDGDWETYETPV